MQVTFSAGVARLLNEEIEMIWSFNPAELKAVDLNNGAYVVAKVRENGFPNDCWIHDPL